MVDMHLEVSIVAVADAERAKRFYQELGWRLDDDVALRHVVTVGAR